MNIAFYIETLNNNEKNIQIYECLNECIKNNKINDASLFFNNVGKVDLKFNFGIFNSTDIWNYTGLLIATSLDNVIFSSKIINKFKLLYLYNGHDNLFKLIDVVNNCYTICSTKEDSDEIYRLTGKRIKNINKLNLESILEVIKNVK